MTTITPQAEIEQIDDPAAFMREFCDLFGEHRGYILMLKAREKQNDHLTHSDEITRRRLITSPDEIRMHYEELKAIAQTHPGLTFRFYLSINGRDLSTAYFNLRDRLNDWSRSLYEGCDGTAGKLKAIGSEWKSCARRPEAKDDSYFLFDLDDITAMQASQFMSELQQALRDDAEIHRAIETPNGFHIICDAFNYTEFDSSIEYDELKKDAQLFIEEFDT